MTGYLQRLVTTAVQGKVGVHPIVRPPRIEPSAEGPAWTEFADEAEPHPGEDAAPAEVATAAPTATAVPDGPVPGTDQPPPTAGHARERTAAEPSRVPEIMTPLYDETAPVDLATPVPAARIGSVARPPVARRSRSGPSADHPSGPARERSDPADHVRSGLQQATARPDPPALPPFRQEPQRWAWPATSGRAEGTDRGDVEIHIGRIEVTAVSPPPAAPVAKAVRKSINLSEYLRNGR